MQNESAAMVDKYNFQNVEPMTFDCLKETEELTKLIKSHDLVISLLPYVFHAQVAEIAINNDTNMVTASYLTDGMVALDQKVGSYNLKKFLNNLKISTFLEIFFDARLHCSVICSFDRKNYGY